MSAEKYKHSRRIAFITLGASLVMLLDAIIAEYLENVFVSLLAFYGTLIGAYIGVTNGRDALEKIKGVKDSEDGK